METDQFNSKELNQIIQADDLHISPLRQDGSIYGTPTWIWAVAVDGDLYVRAYHGTASRWYRSALDQHSGRIHAADMIKDVLFEAVNDPQLNNLIDQAYRDKYSGSPYLAAMIGSGPKSATIRILPIR